jgi:hypothetical protein
VKLRAWVRSPSGRATLAALYWLIGIHTCVAFLDRLGEHYALLEAIGRARMACEARGGVYGAVGAGPDDCIRRASPR